MTTHTCLACGHVGLDVKMRVVEVADVVEQRVVQAAISVDQKRHGPPTLEYRDVRERYIAEPRCTDVRACDARVAGLAPEKSPEAEPEHKAALVDARAERESREEPPAEEEPVWRQL